MKNIKLVNKKSRNIFNQIKGDFRPFIVSFLKKFQNVPFLILVTAVILVLNSYIVFRLNYSEDYKVLYRYERPTITLGNDNYLEMYRFHDYLQYKDKSVVAILTANYQTKSKENKDLLLGLNSGVEEAALGDKADIRTELNRLDAKNFEIRRSITFKDLSVTNQTETVFTELVLGGENISFKNDTITFGKCNLKVNYQNEVFANFQEKEKVLIFSMKSNGSNTINFILKFNLNCG